MIFVYGWEFQISTIFTLFLSFLSIRFSSPMFVCRLLYSINTRLDSPGTLILGFIKKKAKKRSRYWSNLISEGGDGIVRLEC